LRMYMFFYYRSPSHPHLHSFPTRRSSDLADPETAFADEHVVALEYRKSSRGNQQKTETMRRPLYDPSWHLCIETERLHAERWSEDRKSTRLNSSHGSISYAVFCLKKKKEQ